MMTLIIVNTYNDIFLKKSSQEKQQFGQLIVKTLGGKPGPRGRDGGIDGILWGNSEYKAIISVKLQNKPITLKQAKEAFATLIENNCKIVIFISIYGLSKDAIKFLNKMRMKEGYNYFKYSGIKLSDIILNKHCEMLEELRINQHSEVSTILSDILNKK